VSVERLHIVLSIVVALLTAWVLLEQHKLNRRQLGGCRS
jgi:hypothetical protein